MRQVRRVEFGALVETDQDCRLFDDVVLACHSDQALALLGDDASVDERRLLGAIRYEPNRAVLHTDTRLLPRDRALWSAWNYQAASDVSGAAPVGVSYLINRLQPSHIFPQHFGTYTQTDENAFWTRGYPDELKLRLSGELQKRYHKLKQGEKFEIR